MIEHHPDLPIAKEKFQHLSQEAKEPKKVADSLSAEMDKARSKGEVIGPAKFLKSTELKEMVKFALQEGSTDFKNSPEYEQLVFQKINKHLKSREFMAIKVVGRPSSTQ
ncbi:hypothetical protein CDL15_Pgr016761 [Punica granatum]|uniref:Uncharacterized protein n=1 Tax=Punica granatum TaxID=22663 RepID=A0A218WXD3_PUNGR|nr:hypothetical protein CDL15_Pgr016761 [Punica granatum]